jgi:hypothetical protein
MTAPTISALPTAPQRSDAPATFVSRADALLAALAAFVTESNALGVYVDDAAEAIETLVSSAGFSGTSTTSLTIGEGTKSLTVQTARGYVAGAQLIVANTAAPSTNYMYGIVTSYNAGTGALVVEVPVDGARGSGTHTAWTVSLSGPKGPQGESERILSIKTANYTAVAGDRLGCDTTGGPFTVTLPASPANGDRVYVCDVGTTETDLGWLGDALTVARNGSTIMGYTDDVILRERGGGFSFEYMSATSDWIMRRGY